MLFPLAKSPPIPLHTSDPAPTSDLSVNTTSTGKPSWNPNYMRFSYNIFPDSS